MGDRSPASVTVYDCPVDEAAALHKVITDYFVQVEWDAPAPEDVLVIGDPYTDTEMSISIASELGPLMVQAAPGSSFSISSDPYADYLGDEWNYTPALGSECYPIDGSGEVVWSQTQIESFLREQYALYGGNLTYLGLKKALGRAMGDGYREQFTALAATNNLQDIPLKKEN